MNIIIVGAGEIGRHMAMSLATAAHSTVVIERDERLAHELDSEIDARVLNGDGSSVNVLMEANVTECDVLFALTSHTASNVVACSVAKKLGAKKAICRVQPSAQREEWLFDIKGQFDIDVTFSPEHLSAIEVAKFIRNPDSLVVEEIARGRIEIQQVELSEKSPYRGKTLREIKLPERVRVGSLFRNEQFTIPEADEVLNTGDQVILFGETRKLRSIAAKFCNREDDLDELRVVIIGGGEYGLTVGQVLAGLNCRVRLFEKDASRCHQLGEELEGTTIINADGTALSELKEEQVGEADFLIATTGSDEDNVMTCIQANSIGVQRCITLIHRNDYARAISLSGEKLGIMAAISPREVTRREMSRYLTADKFHSIRKFGEVEVIETTVPPRSPLIGKMIREIEWPASTNLIARLRGIHASVPMAEDEIQEGDSLFAMVIVKSKRKFLKLIHP
jgi:trk system potassium uptake protein TrkA